MPAIASLEELQRVQDELEALKMKHPETYVDFVKLFKKHRRVGHKNIVKMLMGETDPEKLKGLN